MPTMIVGFIWGGWVAGGTATEMAEESADTAAALVAASVCAERFMAASDARPQLASLKETGSSRQQRNLIEDGGWTMVAGQACDDAAELCAETSPPLETLGGAKGFSPPRPARA